tara:strand:+ start:816 stop:1436 length:621 start_codon:yes stop_codon:yes gene_type:complete
MKVDVVGFKDFIGVFDTDVNCQAFIDFFNFSEQSDCTFVRRGYRGKGMTPNARKDTMVPVDYFADTPDHRVYTINKEMDSKLLSSYNEVVNACLQHYADEYEQIATFELQSIYLNIQRTRPREGYNIFHCEQGGNGSWKRVLATSLYLNDVREGGETEFLYQSQRIQPKAGRFLIWPAGFTHTHRGNPPLSGEKFLATSWVETKKQ